MMDYLAIDFETATGKRDSACSVAVVEVHNGKIAARHYSLLKPPGNKYQWQNIRIHGIKPENTVCAPSFAQLWPKLGKLLEGNMVLAHNAAFDMGVMRECIRTAGVQPVEFDFCCTVKLARSMWADLPNHRLNTVGDYLGIKFNHHNALDDAITCAEIPIYAGNELGISQFEDLRQKLGVAKCPFI